MKVTRAQLLEMAARTRGFTDEAEFKLTRFGGAIELTVYNVRVEIQSDGMATAYDATAARSLGPEYRQSDPAVASA